MAAVDVESIDRSTSPSGVAAQQNRDQFDNIRQTPEYRAAWDVEVWKHLMQKKLERELRDAQKKAIDNMKAQVALKDKEASLIIEKKIREVADELKKVQAEAAAQETRKRKLIDAEKELRRQAADLLEHKKRVDSEAEDRIKALKNELNQRLTLEAERQKNMEQTMAQTNERLVASQKEYGKLWEEFAEFKSRILRDGGGGILTNQLDTLRAQHATEIVALTERHERRLQEIILQFERRLDDSQSEVKRLQGSVAQKKEHIKTLTSDLQAQKELTRDLQKEVELLKSQLISRSTGGSDRNQTRSGAAGNSDKPTSPAQQAEERRSNPSSTSAPTSTKPVGAPIHTVTEAEAELRRNLERWQKERQRLLETSGGAYTEKSEVIVEITRRIFAATEALKDVVSPFSG
jgi:centrosomal protein CEP120